MANTVVSPNGGRFPVGALVHAYLASKARMIIRQGDDPRVLTAVESQVVAADSKLTFTTLVAGTQYLLASDASLVSVTTEGDATHNEVNVLRLAPGAGGTFRIGVDVASGGVAYTSALAASASAATIQTALEALASIAPGDVTVAGSVGGPFTITFGGALADTAIDLTVDESSVTWSGVSIAWVTGSGVGPAPAPPSWRARRTALGLS